MLLDRLPGRIVLLAAVTSLSLGLGGCLRPMYGGLAGQQLRSDLAAIDVQEIPGRLGYYLARDLRFALNGTGSRITPRYNLKISISQNVQTPLIDTISGRASSATIVIDAAYTVTAVGGTEPVAKGVAFTAVSYDRTSQSFANIRAQRDAEIRAAKVLADQIQVRIASVMSK
ncbi:MAG: hypothetical protein KDJ29_16880 [Hyphomicrobiales bacterium]|nr:hypothetical protein [Hyphomicrobiales bacterium]